MGAAIRLFLGGISARTWGILAVVVGLWWLWHRGSAAQADAARLKADKATMVQQGEQIEQRTKDAQTAAISKVEALAVATQSRTRAERAGADAALRDLVDRLRVAPSFGQGVQAPTFAGGSGRGECSCARDMPADVLGRSAETTGRLGAATIEIGAYADKLRDAGIGCKTVYGSLSIPP